MTKGTDYKACLKKGIDLRVRSEIEYQIFDQVWNRVGKTTDFGLKKGKGFRWVMIEGARKLVAHVCDKLTPTHFFFWKYPPPPLTGTEQGT